MNITSKSRYALKILLDLAESPSTTLVQRSAIVARQKIPSEYLDQIMIRLRAHQLVESVRGRSGGYRLLKDPAEINVWQIFKAAEDRVYPVKCVSEQSCSLEKDCIAKEPWSEIFESVQMHLSQFNLKILLKKKNI